MRKLLLLLVCTLISSLANAYDIEVQNADGITIYYNYINDGIDLAVTYPGSSYDSYSDKRYKGNLKIPNEVIYMNRTRKVVSISEGTFYDCFYLTSVTIPNSVTSIDDKAFYDCIGLTSIEIPNSVTCIGDYAFSGSGLTSIVIPNSVTSIGMAAFHGCSSLTTVTIPNGVTNMGDGVFGYCSSLTSATIPYGVTNIRSTFYSCSSLTSITIPNSVTSIGANTFYYCSSLASVTIPNSVTNIDSRAFEGCSSLTSITIPNSVTSIGNNAFYKCSSLASVTIPNSVTTIGERVFDGANIPTIFSFIENPFEIIGKTKSNRTFSQNTFNNATLYVPKGTIDNYKATGGWKDFMFIEEMDGGDTPPVSQTCEKPTISYNNGKLTFSCATEGATCHYSITDSDIKDGSGNEVQLGVTYNISVYAAKEGYENSETATATLCWIDATPQTEGIANGMTQVSALPVLVKTSNGFISVEGVDDGTDVSIYTTDGKQVGFAVSQNNAATIATSIQPGSIAIVKIGEKAIKVMMK